MAAQGAGDEQGLRSGRGSFDRRQAAAPVLARARSPDFHSPHHFGCVVFGTAGKRVIRALFGPDRKSTAFVDAAANPVCGLRRVATRSTGGRYPRQEARLLDGSPGGRAIRVATTY